MSSCADFDPDINDASKSPKPPTITEWSATERIFGWPVSDAIAQILERVEVADTNPRAHADSSRCRIITGWEQNLAGGDEIQNVDNSQGVM